MEQNMKSPLTVTFIGGPTVLIELGGLRMMTDPTLDPKGAYAELNGKIAEQKTEGPAIQDVGKIDLVLLSHDQHYDNLDTSGRELLKGVPLVLTTKGSAERVKLGSKGLDPWETCQINTPDGDQITITATPARHGPPGIEIITGDVIGFVLDVKGKQNFQLYLTGDTVYFEGVEEVAKKFKPQYVFAFAGAARPRGPFDLTMTSNDVLDTANAFRDAMIIPIHSEGWTHYSENNALVAEAFNILGIGQRLMILEPGKKTDLMLK
jgi:L-ascorbate metabolism protein UlaG (beta-lactamase superfamily)